MSDETRIKIDRLHEHLRGKLSLTNSSGNGIATTSQEILVGLGIGRVFISCPGCSELEFERGKHAGSDVVLNSEDVVEFAVVGLGPQV